MSAKPNYFKLGIFTLIAFCIALGAIIVLGAGALFQKEVMAETYIDESVQGLEVGAAVRYRGVKVGRVRDISFVHNYYDVSNEGESSARYVLVRFTLYPDMFQGNLDRPLGLILKDEIDKRGLRAKLGSQGITGVLYIEIDYIADPEEEPPIEVTWHPDPEIYYIPSTQSLITRISETMRDITDKVSLLLDKFDTLSLDEPMDDLQNLLKSAKKEIEAADIGTLSKNFDAALLSVEKAGKSFQNLMEREEFQTILKDVAAAAENTKGLTGEARKVVDDSGKQLDALMKDLQTAAADFKEASKKVRELTEKPELGDSAERLAILLKRLDRLVAGQQENIESILRNLEDITNDLRAVSGEARDNPSQVIFGGPPKQAGSEEKK